MTTDLDPRAGEETLTIFERSREGRRAFVAPDCDVPELPVEELLPKEGVRERPAELPEVSGASTLCRCSPRSSW